MNQKMQSSKNHTNSDALPERLIRLPELMNLTSLSRASAYRLMTADADFPKPVKIGNSSARNCAVGFSLREVQHWIDKQTEKRGS